MNKTTLFLLRSSLLFSTTITSNFSRVSFPASKIAPIKLIKKGLLQYSSSSRKKTAPQYNSNSLSYYKTKRRPIIAPAIIVRYLNILQSWVQISFVKSFMMLKIFNTILDYFWLRKVKKVRKNLVQANCLKRNTRQIKSLQILVASN